MKLSIGMKRKQKTKALLVQNLAKKYGNKDEQAKKFIFRPFGMQKTKEEVEENERLNKKRRAEKDGDKEIHDLSKSDFDKDSKVKGRGKVILQSILEYLKWMQDCNHTLKEVCTIN